MLKSSLTPSSSRCIDDSLSALSNETPYTSLNKSCIKTTQKNTNILERNKTVETISSTPATSSQMLKPLSPSSISSSLSTSVAPSLSLDINKDSLMQPCIKSTTQNKRKLKNTVVPEVDEVDKTFINLSSIVSEHFLDKKKMDEDNSFGCTMAHQLRKIDKPRKTELKGKIIKIL